MRGLTRTIMVGLALATGASTVVQAQISVPPASAQPVYGQPQLDQLLAPIALYPDPLLGNILMASTYPLEVVQADRWVKDPNNAALRGDALTAALETIDWDPSVKSLVAFPQVLAMMDDRIDWTQKLGDAFLAQQADVTGSIQRLRQQAQASGALRSTPQEVVRFDDAAIAIEPANPQVVYVPAYDPTVYGAWAYPDYPPVYFPPERYYPGVSLSAGIGFGVGLAVVPALWGWNHWDWRQRQIHVDAARYNQINNYEIVHRDRPRFDQQAWAHDSYHRRGVVYRDPGTRAQFGNRPGGPPADRHDFRGFVPPPAAQRQPPGPQRAPVGAFVPPPAQVQNRPDRERERPDRQRFEAPRAEPQRAPVAAFVPPPPQVQNRVDRPRAEPPRFDTGRAPEMRPQPQRAPAFQGFGGGGDVRNQFDRGRASFQASQPQARPSAPPPAPVARPAPPAPPPQQHHDAPPPPQQQHGGPPHGPPGNDRRHDR